MEGLLSTGPTSSSFLVFAFFFIIIFLVLKKYMVFGYSRSTLLCIVELLQRGGSVAVAVLVMTGDMRHETGDT